MLKQLSVLLFLTLPHIAQANSLWQVSDGKSSIIIGGTIHILAEADYPLPKSYHKAFKEADELVFETDIAALQSNDFAQKMLQMMSYTDDDNIRQALNEKTLKLVSDYLESKQLTIDSFLKFKPGLLATTLTIIELQALGQTSQGIDAYFHSKAKKAAKQISWLETPEQQLAMLMKMGEGDANELISYTLKDITTLGQLLSQIKSNWLEGNMDQLAKLAIEPLQQDFPYIYQQLLVQRNQLWISKIEQHLKDSETEFILVGTLHLAGSDSVIEMLNSRGYQIKQLD